MKKLVFLALLTILVASSVSAGPAQSGWDEGLFWAEAGVGALAGLGYRLSGI